MGVRVHIAFRVYYFYAVIGKDVVFRNDVRVAFKKYYAFNSAFSDH